MDMDRDKQGQGSETWRGGGGRTQAHLGTKS